MDKEATTDKPDKLFSWVLTLAVLTVVYNIIEGLVGIYFGLKDETLTLFGFGADSFVETISAIGVTQMVLRIKKNPTSDRGQFELLALKITGWCFYVLVLILTASAAYNIIEGHEPTSTTAGVIIASISIVTMWALIHAKISLGKKLNSAPIIADAKCNQVCLYMSVILLVSSGLWWLWQIPYIDIVGTAGLVYFSIKEGREAFEKAKRIESNDCVHD
ncbi:MAG: cation transporter [Crocinitomicaceae bacterium]|nr:cation transporter [Crocinitomicaceae bacterium]